MADTTTARSQRVALPCPNCGDETPGPYCPTCGQKRAERRVSLRRMFAELVEDQLSLNAALPRTLAALLLRPGHLSREYMAGRIVRYIPPFRLYLVTSVLFFLLLSLKGAQEHVINLDMDTDSVAVQAPSTDSLLWGHDMTFSSPWQLLDSVMNQRLDHFRRMPPQEAADAVGAELLRRAPTAMFLLLPLFAGLLKLLYTRRGRFYVEHFVFALHNHAFVFLLFSIMLVTNSSIVAVPALLWMVLYMYLAMLRFYEQGWLKTLFKYAFLVHAYSIVFAFGIVALLMVAVMLA